MISIDQAMSMATQLQSEGKLDNAETLLQKILTIQPKHAFALHLLGVIAYQTGKISLGIELIEQAIQNNPNVALFHSNLGEMHRQLQAIHLSIQYGQSAIALDPNSALAFSNLGIAYYDAKQYEQAENCHHRALAINPKASCSLNNMGSIYTVYKQPQKALEFYLAAIATSPYFIEPLNNVGALCLQQQDYQQAWEYLNKAILLAPNYADAHCNLGLAYFGLEQNELALLHFEKALQLKPEYAEAYYGLAKVYLYQHHFSEAEQAIRKAITLNPQQVEFYQFLAEIYHEQGQNTQALLYLDQALVMDASISNLYLSKGQVLMEMDEISNAEEQFLKVAGELCKDNQILAYYGLVQLQKVRQNNVNLQNLLSLSQQLDPLSTNKWEYLHFALGKCYDDLGEWSTAFEHFTKGCQAKRRRIVYDSTEHIQFTHKLIHCFNEATIAQLQTYAHPSALPIFIVGMPRSGTTLVEQILSSHAQIFGAGELKYLHNMIQWPIKHLQTILHYPDNILHLTSEIAQTISNQYVTQLQRFAPNAKRITDKMPHNYIAIGVIHALFPNAKIIHVKRNPLDTCLSCYTKLFSQGQLYSYELTELGQYYQCYERIMRHWRQVLPDHAWLEVEYEVLVTHLEKEAKRLIEFCDLSWDSNCLSFYQSKRQVRTASFLQVRQPLYTSSIERWRRYERELTPLLRVLNDPILFPNNKHDQIGVL